MPSTWYAASVLLAIVGVGLAGVGAWRTARLNYRSAVREVASWDASGDELLDLFARQRSAAVLAATGAVFELAALVLALVGAA